MPDFSTAIQDFVQGLRLPIPAGVLASMDFVGWVLVALVVVAVTVGISFSLTMRRSFLKPDALESVTALLEDAAAGRAWSPSAPAAEAVVSLLASRGVAFTSYDDWCALDEAELAAGHENGRPRVKFDSLEQMWAALRRKDGRAAG